MVEQRIFRLVVRANKSDAAFIYFQLEANEGLAFYSTINEFSGLPHRDIQICGPLAFEQDLLNLLKSLETKCPHEVIEHEVLLDSSDIKFN
jgi:hypothetical protein